MKHVPLLPLDLSITTLAFPISLSSSHAHTSQLYLLLLYFLYTTYLPFFTPSPSPHWNFSSSPSIHSWFCSISISLFFIHIHPGIIYSSYFVNKPFCCSCHPLHFLSSFISHPPFVLSIIYSCTWANHCAVQSSLMSHLAAQTQPFNHIVLILFTSAEESNEYEWES